MDLHCFISEPNKFQIEEPRYLIDLCNFDVLKKGIKSVMGFRGFARVRREPVLAMPGYSANPFLLFVIDLLIHAAILSEPVLTFCYSSYNLFETVAYPRRIEN